MKSLEQNRNESDQNWRWPEKTWFQERLKTVKARERESQQKQEHNPPDCAKPMEPPVVKAPEQP